MDIEYFKKYLYNFITSKTINIKDGDILIP